VVVVVVVRRVIVCVCVFRLTLPHAAEKFSRRKEDLSFLAQGNLFTELMRLLSQSTSSGESASQSDFTTVQTVLRVLSLLCRSTDKVLPLLLERATLDLLKRCLQSDEKVVLETIRLLDLVGVILFMGRDAVSEEKLTKIPNLSSGDEPQPHQAIINAIRNKETDVLIEAVENGLDPNFTDDIGQSLLNWTSAFGTIEMVKFLLESGADVQSGTKSSSLHYAACFGRAEVVKTLLQYVMAVFVGYASVCALSCDSLPLSLQVGRRCRCARQRGQVPAGQGQRKADRCAQGGGRDFAQPRRAPRPRGEGERAGAVRGPAAVVAGRERAGSHL
jgi:hypothetical protein